ncbi:MAG: glycosyltransferase [bacterium]
MISIITVVRNRLAMNELFFESLSRYTKNPYELIVVDNGSADGSAGFFESVGAQVIRNGTNYSYPYCQNIGIKHARHDWLAFVNNDVIVSEDWDAHIIDNMQANGLEVASACGVEHLENRRATRRLRRRWNLVKGVLSLAGQSRAVLRLMHLLMYDDWAGFTKRRYLKFNHQIKKGFVGNTVVIHKRALSKIGLWDDRIQAADFDLYLRTMNRAMTVGDVKPMHVCLDSFVHHYIRLTASVKCPAFADQCNLIALADKWPPEMLAHFRTMND